MYLLYWRNAQLSYPLHKVSSCRTEGLLRRRFTSGKTSKPHGKASFSSLRYKQSFTSDTWCKIYVLFNCLYRFVILGQFFCWYNPGQKDCSCEHTERGIYLSIVNESQHLEIITNLNIVGMWERIKSLRKRYFHWVITKNEMLVVCGFRQRDFWEASEILRLNIIRVFEYEHNAYTLKVNLSRIERVKVSISNMKHTIRLLDFESRASSK